jgi:hypothetical protein
MMERALPQSRADAAEQLREAAKAYAGGAEVDLERLEMFAQVWGLEAEFEVAFREADEIRTLEALVEAEETKKFLAEIQSKVELEPTAQPLAQRKPLPFLHRYDEQKSEPEREEPREGEGQAKGAEELVADLTAKNNLRLQLIAELVDAFNNDKSEERLNYNTQKAEVARVLGVTQMDVHRSVKKEIEEAEKAAARPDLTHAQKAVVLEWRKDVRLWTDPMDQTAYASMPVDGHWENYRIGSIELERLLRARYANSYATEQDGIRVPAIVSNQGLHDAVETLKAQALVSNLEITPSLRVGLYDDRLWLNLGGKDWTIVKITPQGWELFQKGVPGVAFIRKKGMLELPIPASGGDIRQLRRFLNVRDEDFVLEVGWLIGALRADGPYPLHIFSGVAGSAKTTGYLLLQRMIDPNFSDLVSLGSTDDIFISANNRHVLGFDNVSQVS